MARSPESRRMRRELDKELKSAAAASGHNLSWSAQESAIIDLLCDEIDRKTELLAEYEAADDVKVKVRLSAEARLLEQSVARLLRQVKTELPGPESKRTVAARRAALARWDRDLA